MKGSHGNLTRISAAVDKENFLHQEKKKKTVCSGGKCQGSRDSAKLHKKVKQQRQKSGKFLRKIPELRRNERKEGQRSRVARQMTKPRESLVLCTRRKFPKSFTRKFSRAEKVRQRKAAAKQENKNLLASVCRPAFGSVFIVLSRVFGYK